MPRLLDVAVSAGTSGYTKIKTTIRIQVHADAGFEVMML